MMQRADPVLPEEPVVRQSKETAIVALILKDDYCSDMTRTVFLGTVSQRQREIYEIVREANLRGIAAAKPGNRMCDVDNAARSFIEEKGFGKYFTHRTGHSIGLEVHEAGDVSAVNQAIIRLPGLAAAIPRRLASRTIS